MSDAVNIQAGNALVSGLIRQGLNIYAKAAGPSMFPVIRPGDRVLVEPKSFSELKIGDIVLYERDSAYIIHRLMKKIGQSAIITRGDNQSWNDQPIPAESVLGRVIRIEGRGRRMVLTGRLSRMFARFIVWFARSRIRGKYRIIRNLSRLWWCLEGRRNI